MGPDIMLFPLLYSMAGRIMDRCPAELTGLVLERGFQSPEPPMGDLCGPAPLFIGPGYTQTTEVYCLK